MRRTRFRAATAALLVALLAPPLMHLSTVLGSDANGGVSTLREEACERGLALADAPMPIDPSDWPMFGRDIEGTRANPVETILSPTRLRRSGLSERWRFATASPVYGTPAVVGGLVYAAEIGPRPKASMTRT